MKNAKKSIAQYCVAFRRYMFEAYVDDDAFFGGDDDSHSNHRYNIQDRSRFLFNHKFMIEFYFKGIINYALLP